MSLEALSVIDLDTSQPFLSVVHGKQYDSVRKVEAHLYFSGAKWYVPDNNIYTVVSFRKTDRIGGFYDYTEPDKNGIRYPAVYVDSEDRSIIHISLDRNIMTVAGSVQVETVFFDILTGDQLSCFSFIVEVEEAAIREVDIASAPYFFVLGSQIADVLEADARFQNLQISAIKLDSGSNPTATLTIAGEDQQYYMITLGIPSMPGITASALKLAPNATPTVQVTGGEAVNQPYNIAIGVPSMPAITTSAKKLIPGAAPTAQITGGTLAGEAYNIELGIPSMPSITASATKLAPNATPSVQVTGGEAVNQPYNIAIGVPSMPAITTTTTTVASATDPSVNVTGGEIAGEAYNLDFRLPRNGTLIPSAVYYHYALGTNSENIPTSGWEDSVSDLGGTNTIRGKFVWTKTDVVWSDNYTETFYLVTYNGLDAETSIDSMLSTTSEHPVQNKLITTRLNELFDAIQTVDNKIVSVDTSLSNSSTNPVQNKAIYNGLKAVQDSIPDVDLALDGSSTNPVQNKVITAGLQAKLDAPADLTQTGLLCRKQEGATSYAKLGEDYGSCLIPITIPAASWSKTINHQQTIENGNLVKSDKYAYIVAPSGNSYVDYTDCGVYADDITTNGLIVFHCEEDPASDLTVNILRVVTSKKS